MVDNKHSQLTTISRCFHSASVEFWELNWRNSRKSVSLGLFFPLRVPVWKTCEDTLKTFLSLALFPLLLLSGATASAAPLFLPPLLSKLEKTPHPPPYLEDKKISGTYAGPRCWSWSNRERLNPLKSLRGNNRPSRFEAERRAFHSRLLLF